MSGIRCRLESLSECVRLFERHTVPLLLQREVAICFFNFGCALVTVRGLRLFPQRGRSGPRGLGSLGKPSGRMMN